MISSMRSHAEVADWTRTRANVPERASAMRRRPLIQAFFRIDSSNERYEREHRTGKSRWSEQNKFRGGHRPVQAVIQQMLPVNGGGLRRWCFWPPYFGLRDRGVSGRDVYGQRK